jgi:hypothetical protein
MTTGSIDLGFKGDGTQSEPRASASANGLSIGSAPSGTPPDTITTPGDAGTGVDRRQVPTLSAQSSQPKLPPSRILHRTYHYLTECLDCLDRATGEEDIVTKENSLSQFKQALAELWDYHPHREEQFEEAVNMLQSIFVGRSLADFDDAQLLTVRGCVAELRDEQVWDDAVLNEITGRLLEAGIDVFRELA